MKALLYLCLVSILVFYYCQSRKVFDAYVQHPVHTFPNTSIRAIKAINEYEVHFAGSDGTYGYTKDKGAHWIIDTIKINNKNIHLRGIEVTSKGVFLMGIGSPSYLIFIPKDSNEKKIVYQENHPDAFYDAIKFSNNLGIMVGDPTSTCPSIVVSKDNGALWNKIPCNKLPPIVKGEAAYAASNSNIAIKGSNIWFGTGGKKARIFHSPDKGENWTVIESPIAEGNKMTGIFSIDFKSDKTGWQ